MNQFRFGSEYHVESSIIDQVTNRATGRKIIEKSNLKLSDNLIVLIIIQCQLLISNFVLEFKK